MGTVYNLPADGRYPFLSAAGRFLSGMRRGMKVVPRKQSLSSFMRTEGFFCWNGLDFT